MKKSILNIISLMCCLTIMLTATSCGNNAKKEEIVVDGIIPLCGHATSCCKRYGSCPPDQPD